MKLNIKKHHNKEEEKPTEIAPVSESLDFDKAIAHRDDVIAYLMSFKGELGHNPWITIRTEIDPLNRRLAEGERSENLYYNLMALKKTPPTI
jgi:hypothetical protein